MQKEGIQKTTYEKQLFVLISFVAIPHTIKVA